MYDNNCKRKNTILTRSWPINKILPKAQNKKDIAKKLGVKVSEIYLKTEI